MRVLTSRKRASRWKRVRSIRKDEEKKTYTPGNCERADKEVREDDDGVTSGRVARDDPGGRCGRFGADDVVTEGGLEGSDEAEPLREGEVSDGQ